MFSLVRNHKRFTSIEIAFNMSKYIFFPLAIRKYKIKMLRREKYLMKFFIN